MAKGPGGVMQFLLSLVALGVGGLMLSILYESLAGNRNFSLPLANIALVVVIGSALFPFWGWTSTSIVLGLYGAWCVVGGLIDRGSASGKCTARTLLSRAEARDLAWREISRMAQDMNHELVLLDEHTVERPWGWVFFYDSRHHQETRAVANMMAGNAPIIVNRYTGEIEYIPTAFPIEEYLANYEEKLHS